MFKKLWKGLKKIFKKEKVENYGRRLESNANFGTSGSFGRPSLYYMYPTHNFTTHNDVDIDVNSVERWFDSTQYSKFKIGDKVVPISKSVGVSFESDSHIFNLAKQKGQNYLYVLSIMYNTPLAYVDFIQNKYTNVIICGINPEDVCDIRLYGNKYLETDLIKCKKLLEDV